MSLGEAFITIRADTTGFQADLDAKLRAAVAASQVTVPTSTTGGGTTGSTTAAIASQQALKDANRDTALSIENGLRDQMAARAALNAQIKEDLLEETTAVKIAADTQKAAIASAAAEEATAYRAATAAQKESTKSVNDAKQTISDVTQALKIPALVTLLGFAAAEAAGLAFAGAVATIGIKAADATRSATLGFQALGLSAAAATAQVKQLQTLADQGLALPNLSADSSALIDVGLSAQASTTLLKELADAFAAAGAVGAVLQTDVDGATSALTSLADKASITSKTFASSISALGLPITVTETYKQLEAELGLTSKQLDDLIAKGKLTGAALANAAVAAATAAGAGGLNNALNQSPTQAIASLKSSVSDALGQAFNAPAVAQGIDKIRDALVSSLGGSSGAVSKFASDALAGIANFIPEAVRGLTDLIPFVQSTFDFIQNAIQQASTKGTALNQFVTDFVGDVQDLGRIAVPILEGLAGTIGEILNVLHPFLDVLSDIAQTKAGATLFEIAGGIGAIALTLKVVTGFSGLIDGATASLKLFAGAETAAAASADALAGSTTAAAGGVGLEATAAGAAEGVEGAGALATALGAIATVSLPEVAIAAVAAFGAFKVGEQIGTSAATASSQSLNNLGQQVGSFGNVAGNATDKTDDLGRVITQTGNDSQAAVDKVNALYQVTSKYNGTLLTLQNTLIKSGEDAQTTVRLLDLFRAGLATGESQTDAFNDALKNVSQTAGNLNINAVISALQGLGETNDQIIQSLENLGISSDAAFAAINSGNTIAAQAWLDALSDKALAAAGSMAEAGAVAQEIFSQSHGGQLGPLSPSELANPTGPAPSFSAPTFSAPSGVSGGGSSAPSAAETAAKAAKTKLDNATSAFKDSLKNFTDALNGPQTRADIDNAITQLQNTINNFDKALGKTEPTGLKTLVSKYNAELRTLGNQLQAVNDQLAAATQATANSVTQTLGTGSLTDIFTSISTAVTTTTVDLSKLSLVLPGALKAITAPPVVSTADAFQAALDAKVKAAQDFQTNITKLQKEGLSAGVLSDLVNGGVAASGATAAQLATETQAQIDAINKSEAALDAVAKTIGGSAGDAAAAAAQNVGESVVAGLVTGLSTKDKALQDAATALGKTISDSVKKELKIKSPSLVMHGLGVHAGTGLVHGLLSTHDAITGAASRLALAAAPDIGVRPGTSGRYGGSPVTTHNNQREIHAPITVHNYGSPDSSGDRVGAAIGRLVIR